MQVEWRPQKGRPPPNPTARVSCGTWGAAGSRGASRGRGGAGWGHLAGTANTGCTLRSRSGQTVGPKCSRG